VHRHHTVTVTLQGRLRDRERPARSGAAHARRLILGGGGASPGAAKLAAA